MVLPLWPAGTKQSPEPLTGRSALPASHSRQHKSDTDGRVYYELQEQNPMKLSHERKEEARDEPEGGEYEKYCAEVFQMVYDKLQEEIKVLMDIYLCILEHIPTAAVGEDRYITGGSMGFMDLLQSLLELRNCIEIRHEKVQEAVIERDRRFRKQPIYTCGTIYQMRNLERFFEDSEMRTILEASRAKHIRTQQLMDVITGAIERGLEAELDYAQEISASDFIPIDSHDLRRPPPYEIIRSHNKLRDLKGMTVKIVGVFYTASLLLNASTYEVKLAKARLKGGTIDVIEAIMKRKAIADEQTNKDWEKRVEAAERDFLEVDWTAKR